MQKLPDFDSQLDDVAFRNHTAVDGDGTLQLVAPADSDRLRLHVWAEIFNQAVAPDSIVVFGALESGTVRPLVVLTRGMTSYTLRIEDWGQALLGEIYSQEITTVPAVNGASSLRRVRR